MQFNPVQFNHARFALALFALTALGLTGCPNNPAPGPVTDSGDGDLDAGPLDAGGGGGGSCTGTARPCGDRAEVECGDLGCMVGSLGCTGIATPCTELDDQPTCDDQPGCTWAATFDAGPSDAGSPVDGGMVVSEGCNPDIGIECDGDWEGRCTPACAAGECCAPQSGTFQCAPRNAAGECPAADLFVDATRITDQYTIEYQYFPEDDCALVEHCVGGPGIRRLLRFDTWTPNQGDADMYLGRTPATGTSSELFEWSTCPSHNHHHFNSYAAYELLDGAGTVAAEGHKQAFCLLDYYHYPCEGGRCDGTGAVYGCGFQGIQRGWQDVYGDHLDCQWVDVTDVPAGDYELHIQINTQHILLESNYDNNEITVPVTISAPPPDVDITLPCAAGTTGAGRDCGYTRSTATGIGTCTAGTSVTLGCSNECGIGTCSGDTVLRVCDASHDPTCTTRWALATNDDSGCGTGTCSGRDCCSRLTFECPPSGSYVVFTGAFNVDEAATCGVAVE